MVLCDTLAGYIMVYFGAEIPKKKESGKAAGTSNNCGESIAYQMNSAANAGRPIPALEPVGDEDDFVMSKINHLIKWMTKYQARERIKLSVVNAELKALKGKLYTGGIHVYFGSALWLDRRIMQINTRIVNWEY